MLIGSGFCDRFLTEEETSKIVEEALDSIHLDGKRVLILIPDSTRTMPMPLMFTLFEKYLAGRVKTVDYLVALGTHQPMTDAQLGKLIGRTVQAGKAGTSHIYNHEWSNPETFTQIGIIPAGEIAKITKGMMATEVPVSLNKLINAYDHLIICGPVFPHEVVGFSGGNKYLFPGIAGPEIINFTHWLGAVITNYKIIGSGYTPVRAVIDRAAAFIQKPVTCFSLVVTHEGLAGMYYGDPGESWEAAAALSAKKHVVYVDKPYQTGNIRYANPV